MGFVDRIARWVPGTVPEITPNELAALLRDEGCIVVDVRTGAEHAVSRIPGSVSMPIHRFDPDALGMSLDARIVAVCLSAHRSIPAVRLLRERGYAQAVQLRGGMLAWWKAGLPVEP
jgi:rhodanese-related sulfurtransferase